VLSGTQGRPLQQSAADAQAPPDMTHIVPRPKQRGTPSLSSLHSPLLPGAEQQLLGNEFDEQPPLPR